MNIKRKSGDLLHTLHHANAKGQIRYEVTIHNINVNAISTRDCCKIAFKVDEVSAEDARLDSLAHGFKPIARSVFSQHGHKHAVCVVAMGVELNCLSPLGQSVVHELLIEF